MNILEKNKSEALEDEALEWLVLLQSSVMSDQEEKAFFEWLNSDSEHQKAFVEAESLWQRGGALSQTTREEAIPVMNAQATPNKPFAWVRSLLGVSGVPTAVFASVCAVFTVFIFFEANSPNETLSFATAYGEMQKIDLAEGTVITLNANSNVEVSLAASDKREVILNHGEVFFDVAHDSSRPFTIKTDEGFIVVLGTKFSVLKVDGKTQITVVEGRVGLLPGAAEWRDQKSALVLTANQQMNLDATQSKPRSIDASKVLAWRRGQLNFEGEPLQYVVDELNRYYNSSVTLASEELGAKKVVAVLPLANDLSANIKHLEQALQLHSSMTASGERVLGEL